MRQFIAHNVPWLVPLMGLALLIAHAVGWKQITVDTTTLVLLALILVSPFIEQVRKIRMGEFEAEIAPGEVQKVKTEVETRFDMPQDQVTTQARSVGETLLDLLDRDHVLALAKLRIELERALTRLHELTIPADKETRYHGLNSLVRDLIRRGTLPQRFSGPLREIISLCNRAIHGEYVRSADARSIIDIGIRLLDEVGAFLEGFLIPVEERTLTPAAVDTYRDAKYRVTTVVPLVENPYLNVRILDQEGVDTLLEGYDEYAEFLVGIEKVEAHGER